MMIKSAGLAASALFLSPFIEPSMFVMFGSERVDYTWVRFVEYQTPTGIIETLPRDGNMCIKDNNGNDILVMSSQYWNDVSTKEPVSDLPWKYSRVYVRFVGGDPIYIRLEESVDGEIYEKEIEADYRMQMIRDNPFVAHLAVDAMKIYSDVCNW
ncbi:MAG: hypothetical protein KDJ88_13545 [Bauldia sp.]|nr:hypothetical protein [Bauldia sp.]